MPEERPNPGPTVRRRQLGQELRRLREASGISREAAAEYIGVQPPTMSRIELGRQGVRAANVKLLLMLYEVEPPESEALLRMAEETSQRGWWTQYADAVPESGRVFIGLEADAGELWTYESELVPGLMQTPGYVRAINRALKPGIAEAELERFVEVRRARQARLISENPPRYRLILNEAVLRRTVGGPEVMDEQLEHIERLAALPQVSLRVLTFAAGAHPAIGHAFVLLRFLDEPSNDCVFVEISQGGVYLERTVDVEHYSRAFERTASLALGERESIAFVASLRRQANEGGT